MSAPALVHVPNGVLGDYLDEVAEVAAMAGRPLDPHQRVAVAALTSYGKGGKWPSFVAGVEGPRQTVGKTGGIMLPVALTLSLTFEPHDVRLWTAHRLDTSQKTFNDVQGLIAGSAELSKRVAKVSLENGDEHIRFTNGAVLQFKARSGRAGRGLSGHDVFADEGLYATDEQFGALLPTMATRSVRHMPRLWVASSAAKVESIFQRRLRRRALAGDQTLTYVGWWASGSWAQPPCTAGKLCTHLQGTPGCALDDRERWRAANPGLGVRTSEDFLEEMRGTLSAREFGREFLGWQEEAAEEYGLPLTVGQWRARTDAGSRIPDDAPRWLGVDVTPDRSMAAIGGAGRRPDGGIHLALVDHRPGTSWLVQRLEELRRRHRLGAILIDTASPAVALVPDLERGKRDGGPGMRVRSKECPTGEIVLVNATAQGKACAFLQDGIAGSEPFLWHRGETPLEQAVEGAGQRPVGDGLWAFARRRSDVDICPLVAVTLALWGVQAVPRPAAVPLVAWR